MTDNLIYITVNNVEIKTGRKVNVNLSFQVFDSTINPTKGNDKNGPMNAKNNIPI